MRLTSFSAGFVRNIENTRLLVAPIAFQGLPSAYLTAHVRRSRFIHIFDV